MKIVENRYGKARVRVARVIRNGDRHEFREYAVAIALEGDFDTSYSEGDNSLVLPTDTMKNTVYALATDPAIEQPERFGKMLAAHFLGRLGHVSGVEVDVDERLWSRYGPFSFIGGPPQRRIAKINATRDKMSVESGVADYLVMKTTGSSFENFLRDEYTTLPEAADRILATSLDALWIGEADWEAVMKIITETFAAHDSKSVQHTLYAIGESVLETFPSIERIRLTMPNKHYLPTKHADVFIPTDEPHGLIEAFLQR
jgi:urate oxidase